MEADNAPRKPTLGRKLGLRSAIVLIFFGFGVLLAGPLTWYNYVRSSEAALEVAQVLIERSGNGALLQTRLLSQPLRALVDGINSLPGSDARPNGFEHPLLPPLLDALEQHPQLYSAYFGEGNGDFYQAISLAGGPATAARVGAPAMARFSLRRITQQGGARLEQWRHLDAERKPWPKPSRVWRSTIRASAPGLCGLRKWTARCGRTCTFSAARAALGSRCPAACRRPGLWCSAWT